MTEKKLRILLAEGDTGEVAAALRVLFPKDQGRLELTVVSAVSTLLPTINVVNPEVIFLDLSLARPDPLDAVRLVHRSAPARPLVVVAEPVDKDYAARSLSLGTLDYVLKGFLDARTLDRVLRAALEQNTLDGLADLLRDPLTGLYIRDGFLTLGSRAMETAKRKDRTLVLLCARIENLPSLRAEYGLGAVESSLREVAATFVGSFRRTDLVARIGESQLAALAVDAAEPSVPVLLQRLRMHIAALQRDCGPGGPLELGMHARFWSPKDTSTFAEFLDSVETGLRLSPVQAVQETASGKTVIVVKKV
jgi:diguanylate cyclase (GGDEF)-like protein